MEPTLLWLLGAALLLLHHQAFSFSVTSPTAERGPLAQLNPTAHRRDKRCSCENQKDKECIFFCHIGIVWVNTPSHVVPYGFGSVRLKRGLRRCLCSDPQDAECRRFCSNPTPARSDHTGDLRADVRDSDASHSRAEPRRPAHTPHVLLSGRGSRRS